MSPHGWFQDAQGHPLGRAEARKTSKKCFKDQLKWQISQEGIDHSVWEQSGRQSTIWKATIKVAAGQFKEERKLAENTKCQRRKQSIHSPQNNPKQQTKKVFICPCCTRTCWSRIGLHGHHRAWDRNNQSPSQWSSDTKNCHHTV